MVWIYYIPLDLSDQKWHFLLQLLNHTPYVTHVLHQQHSLLPSFRNKEQIVLMQDKLTEDQERNGYHCNYWLW